MVYGTPSGEIKVLPHVGAASIFRQPVKLLEWHVSTQEETSQDVLKSHPRETNKQTKSNLFRPAFNYIYFFILAVHTFRVSVSVSR